MFFLLHRMIIFTSTSASYESMILISGMIFLKEKQNQRLKWLFQEMTGVFFQKIQLLNSSICQNAKAA